ncbi:MAG: integrase core domain-containing protein, partial [Sediminibacterium sp.]
FDNLNQVREISDAWIVDYNNHRPHDALGGLPPRVYREKQNQSNGLIVAEAKPKRKEAH